ncbi:MAG: threonine synthase [Balneola sp.]|jgi:threonine synthase|nr:threonine synthase [Balneola sp.]MBE79514.1 threonine synthase [Balneola sp.]HBX67706.1 threonine synthase [Balneolaceae bacterium]|tara:strand:- start:749 stop:2038 length:1290 start_codon:yes stop_codon:yes gene_type:complete
MKYYSTNRKSPLANFQEAIFKGLPDDNGLYMPEKISALPSSFFKNLENHTLSEIGFKVLKQFVSDEIPKDVLSNIVEETLNFDIPLIEVSENLYSLELYHGPTFAFKDVGARFLARSLSHFTKETDQKLTVLVATSGDTGSAVAQGFYEVPNIEVIILYPSGKISDFQEQQMTTLGKNITALEVDGSFDDCQKMVKQAFLDEELTEKANLTSANSINIARLLPQSIYYFYSLGQLPQEKRNEVVISVPSGNYGNLSAGLIAQRMGLKINHFLACSNINDTVPEYLKTSKYSAKTSTETISNAMDVGDPSNFARMLDLFSGSHKQMTESITGYSFTDDETRKAIKSVYEKSGYILDPHGAVGFLGLQKYLDKNSGTGIFLETAHPYKFKETVENEIDEPLTPVLEFKSKEKKSIAFGNDFEELKERLMST